MQFIKDKLEDSKNIQVTIGESMGWFGLTFFCIFCLFSLLIFDCSCQLKIDTDRIETIKGVFD